MDELPSGVQWQCETINLTGDNIDDDGVAMTETLELWFRDPVECVKELLGNPAFKDSMRYAPEQIFDDPEHTVRRFSEMWTGDWWWQQQVSFLMSRNVFRTHPNTESVEAACGCNDCASNLVIR